MNCPSEVSEIILEIIGTGVLKIRKAGWSGDPSRCAMEADHIHNLPALFEELFPGSLEVLLGGGKTFVRYASAAIATD